MPLAWEAEWVPDARGHAAGCGQQPFTCCIIPFVFFFSSFGLGWFGASPTIRVYHCGIKCEENRRVCVRGGDRTGSAKEVPAGIAGLWTGTSWTTPISRNQFRSVSLSMSLPCLSCLGSQLLPTSVTPAPLAAVVGTIYVSVEPVLFVAQSTPDPMLSHNARTPPLPAQASIANEKLTMRRPIPPSLPAPLI